MNWSLAIAGLFVLVALMAECSFQGVIVFDASDDRGSEVCLEQLIKTVVMAPDDAFSDEHDEGTNKVVSETSQNTVDEPRLMLEPELLYAKSRIAVATIATKDGEGLDVGQGSGFFIDPDEFSQLVPRGRNTEDLNANELRYGYLLTNFHVIRGAASAEIRMKDSGVQLDGRSSLVVMENEDLDLALLSVSFIPKMKAGASGQIDSFEWVAAESQIPWWSSGVPTLSIAEGENPAVGSRVYAIGSPLGLDATLSEGIVSGYRSSSGPIPQLQFTAPVSPGSSGGPLLDSTGRVVGVVTALRRDGQNLNFAVPTSKIRDFLKGRCNNRGLWLGASIEKEAETALYTVWDAYHKADGRRKEELLAILALVNATGPIQNAEKYRELLRTVMSVEPSSCGDFEYLWHYACGKANSAIAKDDIFSGRAGPVPQSERNLPAQEAIERMFQRNPDHEAAIRFLNQAIRLNPNFSPACWDLWGAYYNSGRRVKALETANKMVQLVPRCAKAYSRRGWAFRELGQLDLALKDQRTAIDLSPNAPQYRRDLAEIYSKLGAYDDAIDSYEMAIRLGDKNSMTLVSLGFELQKARRFSEAIVRFQKAREWFLANGFQDMAEEVCDAAISECRASKRP